MPDRLLPYQADFLAQRLAPLARPGSVALELGCGRGGLLRALAETDGPPALCLGVDLNARDAPGPGHALARADAAGLPLGDACCDLVFSLAVFEHLRDAPGALREAHRVLKPGGRLLVSANPVWSGFRGHHWGPDLLGKPQAPAISLPWAHLLIPPEKMADYLARCEGFAPDQARRAADFIFASPMLNRLGTADYLRFFEECPLELEDLDLGLAELDGPDGLRARFSAAASASRGLLAPQDLDRLLAREEDMPLVYKFTVVMTRPA